MPPAFLVMMSFLRASILATSIWAPSTLMPCFWKSCCTAWKFSDDCSSALDGMQPTFRQVPPSEGLPSGFLVASTQAVLKPSWAARMAAT
ncbi:hypothetical protein D3C85_1480020 [compost metagenome]